LLFRKDNVKTQRANRSLRTLQLIGFNANSGYCGEYSSAWKWTVFKSFRHLWNM